MLYWTRRELYEVFLARGGWLLLVGLAVFALRSSTLWFSRGKDARPTVDQTGSRAT